MTRNRHSAALLVKCLIFFFISFQLATPTGCAAGEEAEKPATMEIKLIDRPAPDIEFAETVHDFGTVVQNQELLHTFPFRNTGDDTLRIKNVRAT